jgi:putative addiction module component (TIGR02574 family)
VSIDEIKKLNVKERIILMNDIWASLEVEDTKIESPLWHESILKDRIEKLNSGEAKYITLEELKVR